MAHRRNSPADTAESSIEGPVRTCIGCRRKAARSELLRMTASSDQHDRLIVRPDPEGTAVGRGAHLHPTTECYDLAVRRKAFARALRITPGASGLSSVPVGEYVAALRPASLTESTDEDWSSSS